MITEKRAVDNQLVTFQMANEDFGIPVSQVRDIIKIPEITEVPNTPDFFEGVVNLRGDIVSVINMGRRCGLKGSPRDELSRIIVISMNDVTLGLEVDSVTEVFHIGDREIKAPPLVAKGKGKKFVHGMIEVDTDNKIIQLVDLEQVVGDQSRIREINERKSRTESALDADQEKDEEVQVVSFRLGREYYALDIFLVEEIITLPEVTSVPQSPLFIKGVIALRNEMIPLVDSHNLFRLPASKEEQKQLVIIVRWGDLVIGLIVDDISEVLSISKNMLFPPPPNITHEDAEQLDGVIKSEFGDHVQLIMYLNLEKLFSVQDQEILTEIRSETRDDTQTTTDQGREATRNIVCFNVGEEIFGIPIEEVIEIVRVHEITSIPQTPAFISGMINLRGQVITVIDLRNRFMLGSKSHDELTRIIIVEIENLKTGILVDSVESVLSIQEKDFEPPPPVVSGIGGQFIESVVTVPSRSRMLIVINLDQILTLEEKDELSRIGSGGESKKK